MNQKTLRLTTSGIMIGLGAILSFIKVFELPWGGSVTLFSMVPVMVLGYMYGPRWGLLCGAVHGVLQAVFGAASQAFAGQDVLSVIAVLFIDYIVAFSVLGLAGIFKNKIKNNIVAFGLGAACAGVFRYIAHVISGFLIFGSYAEWFFGDPESGFSAAKGAEIMSLYTGKMLSLVYSLIYNAAYMIPETVISVIAVLILMSIPVFNDRIANGKSVHD